MEDIFKQVFLPVFVKVETFWQKFIDDIDEYPSFNALFCNFCLVQLKWNIKLFNA